MLQTERLILRRWEARDAQALYEYAKDPEIGPAAGWPAHRSVEESREVLRTVFTGPEAYAVCLKGDDRPIGAIELKLPGRSELAKGPDECELGYWVGKPFWGQGLIPEATRELLRHAFEDLGMQTVWCGYYDGNTKSKRAQEKCGFRHRRTNVDAPVPLLGTTRTEHINALTRDEWRAAKESAADGGVQR